MPEAAEMPAPVRTTMDEELMTRGYLLGGGV